MGSFTMIPATEGSVFLMSSVIFKHRCVNFHTRDMRVMVALGRTINSTCG